MGHIEAGRSKRVGPVAAQVLVAASLTVACREAHGPSAPAVVPPSVARPPAAAPSFAGTVSYDDGGPAPGALIAITNTRTGVRDAVLVTDDAGHFDAVLAPGDYALAVATDRGFAYLDHQVVPSTNTRVALTGTCLAVRGRASPAVAGTRVYATRYSSDTGDSFLAEVRDGQFALCLPQAHYALALAGALRSKVTKLALPTSSSVDLEGTPSAEIMQPPRVQRVVASDPAAIVDEVVRRDARLIGLGEATHGTAEFFTTRGELSLELARRAGLRAILMEIDAVAAAQLDDYIAGGNVELSTAIPALGFWTIDTYEFQRFLTQLRDYNASTTDRIHLWGIDAQNTALPTKLLISQAAALRITPEDQAALGHVGLERGKRVHELTAAQRASLDKLVARLSTPRTASLADLRLAIAARSLVIQLGYWEGEFRGNYRERRDAGMASIARFIVEQTGVRRACVWAHNGHIQRWPLAGATNLGMQLAGPAYYAIGFYLYAGSARAWDAAGKVGVVSQPIPPAPSHTVEAAVMAATGSPDIAWVPLSRLAAGLGRWLEPLRYVRSLGATYAGEEDLLELVRVPSALDAIVVIKSGHDSSPTPTGVRRAAP